MFEFLVGYYLIIWIHVKYEELSCDYVLLAVGIFTASFCSSIEWIILYYAVLTGTFISVISVFKHESGETNKKVKERSSINVQLMLI